MIKSVKIELLYPEAELFKKFRQYQDIWVKVFNIKGGSSVLHFDEHGDLKKVEYKHQDRLDKKKA